MSDDPLLGSFEELVLLSVARLGENAYGMGVRRDLVERTGRDVNIGAVYATLSRLEAKSFLSVEGSTGGAARGGRRRKSYRLLPGGITALREAHRANRAMWAGLDPDALRA